jgi:hypothetical protein
MAKILKNFYKKKISSSIVENRLLLSVFFKLNQSRGTGDHRTEESHKEDKISPLSVPYLGTCSKNPGKDRKFLS